METSLILFNSGASRSSALVTRQQIDNLIRNKGHTLEAMHSIKADAFHMKESLLKGDIKGFAICMHNTWKSKRLLAENVSNAYLDRVIDSALDAGARAGKVSGAGGGGFVTFLVAPERRVEVIRSLSKQDGLVMTCHFTRHGTEGWRVS